METETRHLRIAGEVAQFSPAKELARTILEHADAFDWSLQGLGMLRTYIGRELRMHIWDPRYLVEGVSEMHTHPWDFESMVVAGAVNQVRYVPVEEIPLEDESRVPTAIYKRQLLACGAGGGLIDQPDEVVLAQMPMESYPEGSWYGQAATEIHVSRPLPGTVTLVRRHFREDRDHAYVFWVPEGEFVSAEPRVASAVEIADIVMQSLESWF